MAEPKNTQYPIPLSGQLLNTSSYEWDTKQFIGFNDLKGSYFQGCLSPFYRSVDDTSLVKADRSFLGPDNRIWIVKGNDIYLDTVNSSPKYSFPETCNFSIRKIKYENFNNLIAATPLCEIYYSQNGDLYVMQGTTEILRRNIPDLLTTVHFDVNKLGNDTMVNVIIGDRVILTIIRNMINVSAIFEKNDDVLFQFVKYLDGQIIFNTKDGMKYFQPDLAHFSNTITDIESETNFVSDGLKALGFSDIIKSIAIVGDNAIFYKDTEVDFTKKTQQLYPLPYRWSGLHLSNGVLTADTSYTSLMFPILGPFTEGKVWYKVKDLLRLERQAMSTIEISTVLTGSSTVFTGKVVSFDTEHSGVQDTFIKNDNSVSGNQIININRSSFNLRVIGTNNIVSNISCVKDEQSQGTIIEPWFTIDISRPIYIDDTYFVYTTTDGITYEIREQDVIKNKVYLDRYIVNNNAYGINCFDTKTRKFLLLGTDVGNSFIKGYNNELQRFDVLKEVSEVTYYKPEYTDMKWAALAVNEQYPISGISVSSSLFNSVPFISKNSNWEISNLLGTKIDSSEPNTWANFYLTSDNNLSSTPEYNCSFNFKKLNNIEIAGTTFPNNDNILLSICPSTNIENTYLLYNNIKLNNKLSAQLATFEGENLLNYFLASVSYNVQEIFTIAGNIYSIKNNVIFQSSVNNGVVSSISPIINIGNMSLIGTLPLAALFYSDTNKKLYAFTGDANLSEFIDLTRYGKPLSVRANTTSQDIVLIYRKEALIINDNGIWELPFYGFEFPDDIFFSENEIIFRKVWSLFRYSYYKINENYSVVPLKLATCFYGLQNNIVSTNDCIYIRLYNPNNEDGYLKMKATTLMNGVKETSLKEIALTKEMFDEQSKTYYHRFQPELQKATSESLEIETTFSVGAIIFSNQPETALIASQGSKGMKGHNF